MAQLAGWDWHDYKDISTFNDACIDRAETTGNFPIRILINNSHKNSVKKRKNIYGAKIKQGGSEVKVFKTPKKVV